MEERSRFIENMNTRLIARRAVITAVLLTCIFGASHIIIRRTEPYKFAVSWIKSSPTVRSRLGVVTKVWIGLSGPADSTYDRNSGNAEYDMKVVGENGRGAVHLNLEKAGGAWFVKSGQLTLASGQTVPLSPSDGESH